MIPIKFFKSEPTEYVLVYRGGRLVREGSGLALFYWQPTTSIALVPTGTVDAPFVFNETTKNFQAVTVQGQLTYRIAAPTVVAALLDFTIHPRRKEYRSEDPDKLAQRVVNVVQKHTRHELLQLTLEDALHSATTIAQRVLTAVTHAEEITAMGVVCVDVFFTSIKPIPEMAKALEAEHREALQKRADEAIYARRAAAVEQERKIKANELATEVALEKERTVLVDLQGANVLKAAEAEAEATKMKLAAYTTMDPKILLALAFKELGANAQKIGNLTITPDLLGMLLSAKN